MGSLPVSLQQPWKTIEDQRKNLFRFLAEFPDEAMSFAPEPSAWNPSQVIEHLMLAEGGILKHSIAKQRQRAPKVKLSSRFKYQLMRFHFAFPVIKTKAPPRAVPEGEVKTCSRLESEWGELRTQWFDMLTSLTPPELEAGVFYHPITGPLDPVRLVRWMAMHAGHHRKQINNVLNLFQNRKTSGRR